MTIAVPTRGLQLIPLANDDVFVQFNDGATVSRLMVLRKVSDRNQVCFNDVPAAHHFFNRFDSGTYQGEDFIDFRLT